MCRQSAARATYRLPRGDASLDSRSKSWSAFPAADHQRGLSDLLDLVEPLAARCFPLHQRGSLSLGRLRRTRRLDVDGAQVSPEPEVPAGGPTRFGALEEEKEVVLQGEFAHVTDRSCANDRAPLHALMGHVGLVTPFVAECAPAGRYGARPDSRRSEARAGESAVRSRSTLRSALSAGRASRGRVRGSRVGWFGRSSARTRS